MNTIDIRKLETLDSIIEALEHYGNSRINTSDDFGEATTVHRMHRLGIEAVEAAAYLRKFRALGRDWSAATPAFDGTMITL